MGNDSQKGLTLVELLVVIAIVGILAAAAMPVSRMAVKRTREMVLRNNLRILRTAIDAFRKDCMPGGAPGNFKLSSDYCKADQDYYPETLELLTQPLKIGNSVDKTRKYLRRIPSDPMMPPVSADNPNNWALLSYSDQPDSKEWGGGNVYDVYSKSEAIAIDGTKYDTW